MSRARVALATALTAALTLLLGSCGGDDRTSAAEDQSASPHVDSTVGASAAIAPTAGPSVVYRPGRDDERVGLTPGAEATPPLEVAARFAAAWVRSDLPADQWWREIGSLCEPNFCQGLRTVDPALLPAGRVTGEPVAATEASLDGAGRYEVSTDGGVLVVTVGAIGDRWLVTDNDFVRAAG